MQITERQVGPVTVLDLHGRLVFQEGGGSLSETVNRLVGHGERQFLLNFEDVPYIDSAGIGTLVAKFMTVKRHGGVMKLLRLTTRTEHPLRITKLTSIFEIFNDEAEALGSFSTPDQVA